MEGKKTKRNRTQKISLGRTDGAMRRRIAKIVMKKEEEEE